MKKIILYLIPCSTLFCTQAIVVDPDFSPYAGAYDILFSHWALEKGQDRVIRPIKGDRTSKAWLRFLELVNWDLINGVLDVTQHEVFGHGYRLRELGFGTKGYWILPWEGATFFEADSSNPFGEIAAISIAGLEAEAILARKAKLLFIQEGVIDPRRSTLYTKAAQSLFWYTLITQLGSVKNEEEDSIPSNDVDSYLFFLRKSYPKDRYSIGTLTKFAFFNWLDPMTFYSYISWVYYVAEGVKWCFPMIPLTDDICYLPNIRIGYAPYAPEVYLENFFSFCGDPFYGYVKASQRSFGIGFSYDYIFSRRKGRIGINIDGWIQHKFVTKVTLEDAFEGGKTAVGALKDKVYGFAGSVTGAFFPVQGMGIFGELGGKTKGYLPGYALDQSIVARMGIIFER